MTPDEEIRLANEARQVLGAEVFQTARKNIEDQLANIRRSVPIRDTEMHTRVILMGQLWDNLTGYLEQLVQTGKFAELQLDEKRRKASLLEQGVALWRAAGRNGV